MASDTFNDRVQDMEKFDFLVRRASQEPLVKN